MRVTAPTRGKARLELHRWPVESRRPHFVVQARRRPPLSLLGLLGAALLQSRQGRFLWIHGGSVGPLRAGRETCRAQVSAADRSHHRRRSTSVEVSLSPFGRPDDDAGRSLAHQAPDALRQQEQGELCPRDGWRLGREESFKLVAIFRSRPRRRSPRQRSAWPACTAGRWSSARLVCSESK